MADNRNRTVISIIVFSCLMIWVKMGILDEQANFVSIKSFTKKPSVTPEQNNYFNQTIAGSGVIVSLKGGIGNQLFQYACSYALARDRNCSLYNFVESPNISLLLSDFRAFQPFNRDFALDKFQVPMENFFDKTTVIGGHIGYLSDRQMLFRNYDERPFLQLNGAAYCQSGQYWSKYRADVVSMFQLRPEVVQDFPPYVKQLHKDIESSRDSVAVHVRRGDFTTINGFYTPISYQRSAIRRIIKMLKERQNNSKGFSLFQPPPPKFFVFSDDIDYVRNNFQDLAKSHEFVFVSGPPKGNRTTSIEDFFLMSKCKHFIIPNSTFAWWAAYLSREWGKGKIPKEERIVIASAFNPKFWELWPNEAERNFYKMLHGQMYHPKDWTILNTFVGE